MGKPRLRLLAGVRVDRAKASVVTSVQALKEVEGLSPSGLPQDDPVWAVP